MFENVVLMSIVAVAMVVVAMDGRGTQTIPGSEVEFSREGSFHLEGTIREEKDVRETNMIIGRPDEVTVIPEGNEWRFVKVDSANAPSGGQEKEGTRRHRPHNTKRNRKHRGYRRRWKKKHYKKYYRGNSTYRWETGSHHKIGNLRTKQGPRTSPNQREAWGAGRSFRSLDPRRVKVRRHLVRQHNLLRSKVDPPAADMLAVKWYKTAAEQAQAWAEQCEHDSHLEHPSVRWTSSYGACGQNVFISPTKMRWSQVLHQWWDAKRNFRYGHANNMTEVTAYTQMAWYNSHQLGCGISQCHTPGGNTFFRYVCNYCPTGNDPERLGRPYSEGASCSLCPRACRSMCPRRRCPLCTNACSYTDLWVNCQTLDQQWHEWLCNTKTSQGVERFKNCRATCQCVNEIT